MYKDINLFITPYVAAQATLNHEYSSVIISVVLSHELIICSIIKFLYFQCLSHTWYLAIDMQLHILSPLVLVWVLSGKRNRAWSALILGLLASLTASSIYNFLNNFNGSNIQPK